MAVEDLSDFGQVATTAHCLPASFTSSANPWFEHNCTHFAKNMDAMLALANEYVAKAVEAGVNHSHHLLDSDAVEAWPFNAENGVWEATVGIKPVLQTLRRYFVDTRHISDPGKAQRRVVQMLRGEMLAVLIPCAMARLEPDLGTWLKNGHHSALNECDVFHLTPGDALLVPLGVVPVFMGLRLEDRKLVVDTNSKSKRSADQYSCFVSHLPFSVALDRRHPEESQQFAVASFLQCSSAVPGKIRNHAGVEKWRQALEAVVPAAGTAAA